MLSKPEPWNSSIQVRGGTAAVREVLAGAINRAEGSVRIWESVTLAYWARVVGPQAAAASVAVSARAGVLVVETKSSVWSHELAFHKSRIMAALNRLAGREIIREIVYRARGVSARNEPVQADVPSQAELDAVALETPELEELGARIRSLGSMTGQQTRTAIAHRITQEVKLRHWRVERGWRVCPRCAAAHKGEFRVCPICRLCP